MIVYLMGTARSHCAPVIYELYEAVSNPYFKDFVPNVFEIIDPIYPHSDLTITQPLTKLHSVLKAQYGSAVLLDRFRFEVDKILGLAKKFKIVFVYFQDTRQPVLADHIVKTYRLAETHSPVPVRVYVFKSPSEQVKELASILSNNHISIGPIGSVNYPLVNLVDVDWKKLAASEHPDIKQYSRDLASEVIKNILIRWR